jgi:hypothetical protein
MVWNSGAIGEGDYELFFQSPHDIRFLQRGPQDVDESIRSRSTTTKPAFLSILEQLSTNKIGLHTFLPYTPLQVRSL